MVYYSVDLAVFQGSEDDQFCLADGLFLSSLYTAPLGSYKEANP